MHDAKDTSTPINDTCAEPIAKARTAVHSHACLKVTITKAPPLLQAPPPLLLALLPWADRPADSIAAPWTLPSCQRLLQPT